MGTLSELDELFPEPTPDALFAKALEEWAHALHLLHEPLRAHTIANAYIAGLVHAGIKAENGKVWGTGKYPRRLPFVIEFPCPFDHRTPDEYDYARVRIVTRDNGWWSLDPASPCRRCDAMQIERWFLTCPRCEAGEDSERHYPDHDPLDVFCRYEIDHSGKPDDFTYDDSGGGFDASPASWVVREFERLRLVAMARWWLEHTDDAAASLRGGLVPNDRERFISDRLAEARETLGAHPKRPAIASRSAVAMTSEGAATWLDRQGVPPNASQREALRLTEGVPGRPAKNTIEAAQSLRKRRGTEA